jgi:sec-independent protein translocase protein TatC
MAEKRPYIIVGAFIFGMFLTPPDVISQVLLAIPIWVLFEAGVIASRIIFKDRLLEAEDNLDDDDDDDDDLATEGSDHHPLSDEEMNAERDSIEASDATDTKPEKPDNIGKKDG